MRTLLEVEPRTPLNSLTGNDQYAIVISQSGSYYLTGDITVAGKHGLAIGADHVTIDLNGFTFRGPGNLTAVPGCVSRSVRDTAAFYRRMFENHPALLRNLFNRGNQAQGAQQRYGSLVET